MNTVYLSKHTGMPLVHFLQNNGYQLNFITGDHTPVYKEVSTHADIYMCQIGLYDNPRLFMGNPGKLKKHYPGNIIYNAVCTDKYFIHNLKYTDVELLTAAESPMRRKVHVRQGYSRCCCLPVTNDSFITSDIGIAKNLKENHADVLLIEKGHILLPGFDYGFIGGCAGHLLINGKPTILFNGNLAAHPDHEKMADFIKARHVETIYFESYDLEDIGSIITGANVPTVRFPED